jgi:hypothetical protein
MPYRLLSEPEAQEGWAVVCSMENEDGDRVRIVVHDDCYVLQRHFDGGDLEPSGWCATPFWFKEAATALHDLVVLNDSPGDAAAFLRERAPQAEGGQQPAESER